MGEGTVREDCGKIICSKCNRISMEKDIFYVDVDTLEYICYHCENGEEPPVEKTPSQPEVSWDTCYYCGTTTNDVLESTDEFGFRYPCCFDCAYAAGIVKKPLY